MEAQNPRAVSEAEREKATEERRQPWLTTAQLHELQMQSAAYRYIAAGLPIPVHLMVAISSSLALSSWSHYLTMFRHHYSSWSSYQGFIQREMMDPEPARCRRTDGKKWRCSKTVVPFQKYCERHMHRGRKRSRKLVESSQTASSAPIESIKQENNDGLDNSMNQSLHHPKTLSPNKASMVTIASYTDSGACKDNNNIVEDKVSSPSCAVSASIIKSESCDNMTGKNMERNDKEERLGFLALGHHELPAYGDETELRHEKCRETNKWMSGEDILSGRRHSLGYLHRGSEISDASPDLAKFVENSKTNGNSLCQSEVNARSRYLNRHCNTVKWSNIKVGGHFVPGLHFSPDSVLQDRGGSLFHRIETENEPGRCRRTDGKKWRCSKDASPGQKYCHKHMHRGVKKRPEDNNLTSIPCTVTTTAGYTACKEAVRSREENVTLDARLSASVPANPPPQSCEDKDASSNSSDTTITDTALKGVDQDELSLDSGV